MRHSALRAVAAVALVLAVAAGALLLVLDAGSSRESKRRTHAPASVPPARHIPRPRTIVMVVFDELPLTSLMGPGEEIDAAR